MTRYARCREAGAGRRCLGVAVERSASSAGVIFVCQKVTGHTFVVPHAEMEAAKFEKYIPREVVVRPRPELVDPAPDPEGETFAPELDRARLGAQAKAVWGVVSDGRRRTLAEISEATGAPEASVSARLRDFRKPAFGGHDVKRARRGDPTSGVFEYWIAGGDG